MNDREQALKVLKEAREILAARLTERVLESAEEILEDARGETYLSEIESVHDEVGIRLIHINQMISNLPARNDSATAETVAGDAAKEPLDEPAVADTVRRSPLALPAPHRGGVAGLPRVASFRAFAMAIQLGDVEVAGRQLASLFDIGSARAQQCAAVFLEQLRQDPEFLSKARQLRQALATGGNHGAMLLLQECFGLQTRESLGVVRTLRVRIAQLD